MVEQLVLEAMAMRKSLKGRFTSDLIPVGTDPVEVNDNHTTNDSLIKVDSQSTPIPQATESKETAKGNDDAHEGASTFEETISQSSPKWIGLSTPIPAGPSSWLRQDQWEVEAVGKEVLKKKYFSEV